MKLVIEDEAGTRSVVPFAADAIVVGRGTEGVTFRLGDRNVSRRHARFLLQGGAVSVEDLGSLLGTRANGERITGRRRLRDGDLVQIGDYDVVVLAEGQSLEPRAPPPLPAGPRPDANAVTVRLPLVDPTPTSTAAAPVAAAAAAAAPAPPRSRTLRVALAVAVVALAAGLAAGWAAGALVPR